MEPGLIPKRFIRPYESNPDFPALISFPRTGSHWFRAVLEKYADRPLLHRSFFHHKNADFLLTHRHDEALALRRRHVIYMHRWPTDVIFSQLNYYQQDTEDDNLIRFWSHQYALHLIHWLYTEQFTRKKLVISYRELKEEPAKLYSQVCDHLGLDFNESALLDVYQQMDKQTVKSLTDDEQAVNRDPDYNQRRQSFLSSKAELILDIFRAASEVGLKDQNKLLEAIK